MEELTLLVLCDTKIKLLDAFLSPEIITHLIESLNASTLRYSGYFLIGFDNILFFDSVNNQKIPAVVIVSFFCLCLSKPVTI